MYPVSQSFLSLLRTDHKAITKVEILIEGELAGEVVSTISGGVSIDANRSTRRTLDIQFADMQLIPKDEDDLLYPVGHEIKPYRGIRHPDGTDELIPLGVFGFVEVDTEETDSGITLSTNGFDRSERLRNNPWSKPFKIPKGTRADDAIELILADRWPDLPALIVVAKTDYTTPQIVYLDSGTDPWTACENLAKSSSRQIFFDNDGVPTLDNLPDLGSDPELAFGEGSHIITQVRRNLSTSGTYNGVIASGEGSDLVRTLRAEYWDEEPSSPFYRYGPLGEKPYFYSSPLLLTLSQCEEAAERVYNTVSGIQESADWQGMVIPNLDAYDIISITREAIGLRKTLVLDSLDIPLSAEDGMSALGRSKVETTT